MISQLMIGNITAVKPAVGNGPYEDLLISLGFDMSHAAQKGCLPIAKNLAVLMNMNLLTAADLPAYVAERVAQQGSPIEHAAAAADGAAERTSAPLQQTLFYLTQKQLGHYKDQLDQLPAEENYHVVLQTEPNEKGELQLSRDDLPKTLKHLVVVDPQNRVTSIGDLFCAHAQGLRTLTLNLPALKTMNLPALKPLGEEFFV